MLFLALLAAFVTYFYLLRERLLNAHPKAKHWNFTTADLKDVSYSDIDMLDAIGREPTQEGYAVIGGSGYLGQ
jgi:hypothetical protein